MSRTGRVTPQADASSSAYAVASSGPGSAPPPPQPRRRGPRQPWHQHGPPLCLTRPGRDGSAVYHNNNNNAEQPLNTPNDLLGTDLDPRFPGTRKHLRFRPGNLLRSFLAEASVKLFGTVLGGHLLAAPILAGAVVRARRPKGASSYRAGWNIARSMSLVPKKNVLCCQSPKHVLQCAWLVITQALFLALTTWVPLLYLVLARRGCGSASS